MMRSLFSGVAGLKTHQTRMDVIGNNIANVNTTAYKSQSMTFSDLMYQTTQAASGANPTTGVGGVNARQIGLGAKTSAIKTAITQQGASQTTNDPFDIMITGDAFFVVSNGKENFFTRDGSFYVDGAGNLAMTSTGYNVMGWQTDDQGVIKKDTVTPLRIMSAQNMTYPPEATTEAELSGIIDAKDTDLAADSAGNGGKVVTFDFYDNLGYKYTARFTISGPTTGSGTEGGETVETNEYTMKCESVLDSKGEPLSGTAIGDATLSFSAVTGKLISPDVTDGKQIVEFDPTPLGSSFTQKINIDCSGLTNFNNNGSCSLACTRGDKDGLYSGRMLGEMSGISVTKDGRIYAAYDNGMSKCLGQISTATFANASGLEKAGDNLYRASQNSGEFDGIGEDITVGGGYMNSGVLEMSNVDLSAEFTEMITTQRGFQANSRIITVSDTLLEELTNLKR